MKSSGILVAGFALGGCAQVQNWQHPEVAVCEEYLKSTLKSPSSYKRAKASISDSRLPAAYWSEKLAGESAELREMLADATARSIQEGGQRTVIAEYDADNSFGASIRGIGMCKFEMRSVADNKFSVEPSATGAIADVAAAAAGIDLGSRGCCESKATMALFEKHEAQAQFISQQVLN